MGKRQSLNPSHSSTPLMYGSIYYSVPKYKENVNVNIEYKGSLYCGNRVVNDSIPKYVPPKRPCGPERGELTTLQPVRQMIGSYGMI